MKNFLKLFALSFVLIGISFDSMAVTIAGTASLKIVTPISISETTPLRFGSFAPGSGGTIDQDGVVTGGVVASASTRGPGTLSVAGDSTGTWNYTLSIPSSVTLTSGANSMTSTLTYTSLNSSKIISGSDTITVNGVLTVGANQANGTYNGTYTVTVQY